MAFLPIEQMTDEEKHIELQLLVMSAQSDEEFTRLEQLHAHMVERYADPDFWRNFNRNKAMVS